MTIREQQLREQHVCVRVAALARDEVLQRLDCFFLAVNRQQQASLRPHILGSERADVMPLAFRQPPARFADLIVTLAPVRQVVRTRHFVAMFDSASGCRAQRRKGAGSGRDRRNLRRNVQGRETFRETRVCIVLGRVPAQRLAEPLLTRRLLFQDLESARQQGIRLAWRLRCFLDACEEARPLHIREKAAGKFDLDQRVPERLCTGDCRGAAIALVFVVARERETARAEPRRVPLIVKGEHALERARGPRTLLAAGSTFRAGDRSMRRTRAACRRDGRARAPAARRTPPR